NVKIDGALPRRDRPVTDPSDHPDVMTAAATHRVPVRVLLVEDHEVLAELLVTALRREGLDAFLAPDLDVDSVLRAAEELRPDVAILDLYLDRGLTSLPTIRPLVAAGIQVLILSGSGND